MGSRSRLTDPLDQTQLAGFAARRRERSRLEVEDLLEALDWALRHPASDPGPYAATARGVVDAGWLAPTVARAEVVEQAVFEVFEDPWIPAVDWSGFAPMAAAMGRSTTAGKALVTDALILATRLPLLFEAVRAGRVEVWRARRVAQAVRMRPVDVAEHVDATVTPIAASVGATRLEAIIDEAMLRLHAEERELEITQARESYGMEVLDSFPGFHGGGTTPVAQMRICADIKDLTALEKTTARIAAILRDQHHHDGLLPESLEVRKARAVGILADPHLAAQLLDGANLEKTRSVHGLQLVIHLSPDQAQATIQGAPLGLDPIARIDGPLRTRLTEQVATWCARPETTLTVLPVIDLNQHTESTADTVTEVLGRRARLRTPTCVFPYCDRPSRACDIDHLIPTGHRLGQHGSTCDCNLVPLCRHHHRLKTFAGWTYTEIEPQIWLWTDPHGRTYLHDHHTTRDTTTTHPEPPLLANPDQTERRDQLRRQRLPIRTGCREPDPVITTAGDPSPF